MQCGIDAIGVWSCQGLPIVDEIWAMLEVSNGPNTESDRLSTQPSLKPISLFKTE